MKKPTKRTGQQIKRRCPKCRQETYNKRIHRSKLVKLLLGWLPLEQYQCNMCKLQFYRLKRSWS